ncbi:hypothetical protein [Kingella sp. (in: b-proteobacteria)]|nr:hypothetical protein [Kingella sp. (in: b-proteobacteria)]MDO4656570.1 hypothetical protein [Kingella sp. (in: b-proteobacteria)]
MNLFHNKFQAALEYPQRQPENTSPSIPSTADDCPPAIFHFQAA